ncbi:MAG TPA: outer membrane protein assembly factor BamD [Spirochaetota bacterium]|nr:outer membrane protein assembly factor BamD [Spirochaetota bacterium]HPC41505.1 outer membrane protein assembly factor BamD [Spirochaetota bacterium]HPL15608.1 outer membrane protein assembly factor BamD [Spirochaetota bacterium]HQF09127.1 outer membrane protein assembly factor BamD [Spirochaetota bacterium]HQH97648.1 outer membrane protein assembly factor BamD [Spirochaetota bacterium]
MQQIEDGKERVKKTVIAALLALAAWDGAMAGEKEVRDMALWFYSRGDYHAAITEAMRYQCLYPSGPWLGNSALLMGKAYYRGNNYRAALETFAGCHRSFQGTAEGEEALYLAGFVQLMKGSPPEALSLHDLYRATYRKGAFLEELDRDACVAAVFAGDRAGALKCAGMYRERHPGGKFSGDVDRLEKALLEDSVAPRRHLWLSVMGSALFPGFGHLYTGNYATGFLTLFTNALCIFMIYNGYRLHDTYQMAFFGIAEGILYGYNLLSAARAVNEYNGKRDRDLFRRVQLGITASF